MDWCMLLACLAAFVRCASKPGDLSLARRSGTGLLAAMMTMVKYDDDSNDDFDDATDGDDDGDDDDDDDDDGDDDDDDDDDDYDEDGDGDDDYGG